MRFFRCKCGAATAWSSMGVQSCTVCKKCGSTLAEGPSCHPEPKSHEYVIRYEPENGKPYQICMNCLARRELHAGAPAPILQAILDLAEARLRNPQDLTPNTEQDLNEIVRLAKESLSDAPKLPRIFVNALEHEEARESLSYDDVAELAGKDPTLTLTMTWSVRRENRSGTLTRGQSVPVENGMMFCAMLTGSA